MDDWKKLTRWLLIVGVLLVGIRLFLVYRERHEPVVTKPAATNGYTPTEDDYVFLKKLHPEKPSDLRPLIGTTVWVNAGDQLPYFATTMSKVNYAKQAGVLRGATPLHVIAVLESVPPKTLATRVPNGTRQALLQFTLPSTASAMYATPVGWLDNGTWTFLADSALFYEDPHKLYSWPTTTWQAIEEHRAVNGMTEQQAALALGQVQTFDSSTVGDRTVHYDNMGHPVDVTFVKGHATQVSAK